MPLGVIFQEADLPLVNGYSRGHKTIPMKDKRLVSFFHDNNVTTIEWHFDKFMFSSYCKH